MTAADLAVAVAMIVLAAAFAAAGYHDGYRNGRTDRISVDVKRRVDDDIERFTGRRPDR